MAFGFGFGMPRSFAVPPFSPASLFANGEQGWWYDPSNFSTLFQDSAGTTPVTAMEQPVGLQLDLSKGGVGSNGSARYNLLSKTEQFENAAWTKLGVTVTANQTLAPNGTSTADLVVVNNGSQTNVQLYQDLTALSASTSYTIFSSVKKTGARYAVVGWLYSDGIFGAVSYDLDTQLVSRSSGAGGFTIVSSSITDQGNGWYLISVTATTPSTAAFSRFPSVFPRVTAWTLGSPDGPDVGDGTSGIYVWGADLRLTSQVSLTPTYQPIDTSWTASIPGNHRFQTTSANRPVVSARVNLLTKTEQFNDAYWTKFSTTSTTSVITSTANGGNTYTPVISISGAPKLTVLFRVAKTTEATKYPMFALNTSGGTAVFGQVILNTNTGIAAVRSGIPGATNLAVVDATTYWQLTYDLQASSGNTGVQSVIYPAGSNDGSSFASLTGSCTIYGVDLRVSNIGVNLPAYQRVNTSTDYDTTGFPTYIKPNGSNQFMVTNSINFSATDKMTVWQGVRKLSDAARGMLMELSASVGANSGTFLLSAPESAAANYGFGARGSLLVSPAATSPSYVSPITNVLSGISSISDDVAVLRVNGTQAASQTGDIGTGNFGTYPAYFYMRAGTSLPFSGHDYGSIARGAASTAAQITAGETYMNSKTKAY